MQNSLVSICIPVFNGEKYITETLDSLMAQTYKNFEIIIGDNQSTDKTHEKTIPYIEKDSRIKYVYNDINLGYSGNCNKLISLAKGEYIAIYHADDIYEPNIIEKEVYVLDTNENLAGVFTWATIIDEFSNTLPHLPLPFKVKKSIHTINIDIYIRHLLEGKGIFYTPTSMIRKKVYEEKGGYSTGLKYIEDQDMWLRILSSYLFGVINERVFNYRIHRDQGSAFYNDINRTKTALPIAHVEEFLTNQNILSKYKKEINYAKAKDFVQLAIFAVKVHDYELFTKQMHNSLQYGRILPFNRFGLIQNFPFKKCLFRLLCFYIKHFYSNVY